MRALPEHGHRDVLGTALRSCAGPLVAVCLFSAVLNVLGLTGSLYMLQVYDRVLPSRSIPTLVALTIMVVGLYLAFGLLDFVRLRLLVRIGNRFDQQLHALVFRLSLVLPLRSGLDEARMQPTSDLDQIRSFMSGSGPSAFFDLPWLPFYLLLIYMLHPMLGVLATLGALVSVAATVIADLLSRAPARRATEAMVARKIQADAARRNAEVVQAMGLGARLSERWASQSRTFLADQRRISDVVASTGTLSRTLRMMLQSLMLGLGAYLVIENEASAGVIIASSIMLSRALAPVDTAISSWRSFVNARQSYARLKRLLAVPMAHHPTTVLPAPKRTLSVETLSVAAPGQQKVLIQNIGFTLSAGSGLGIVGASGSGKSTLARALVGAWAPARGKVRLDDAALDQWDPDALGRHIGYLPQDIELFDGSVADNISRFDEAATPSAVQAAAQAAGILPMILRLPQGFQTRIGEEGVALSAGQRQLVGIARALYGDPFLVVLDEPNSNLDGDGEAALSKAIASVRQRGGIVVVVAHRPSALAGLDHLLFMVDGTMQAFGPRDEVLARIIRPVPAAANAATASSAAAAPLGDDRAQVVVPLHERR
ncbi:type I secretion system permease/ATPase [Mangrovicella endophytica]|uniref:type I secretion system permease/ATPase n=1 Tax=Mangrovicella endophytica TaxID=2066697 RepID=UPI000C9E800B|nr:type I secretion system permease/ATPase [Mangrovicella endophytica]